VLVILLKKIAVKYSERHQADVIEVYKKFKMVAKMAAKIGCFFKMISIYVVYILY